MSRADEPAYPLTWDAMSPQNKDFPMRGMTIRERFVMAAMQSPAVADAIRQFEQEAGSRLNALQRADWYMTEAASTLAALEQADG